MTLLVVHLVRAQNGPEPLQRFLSSYLAHPAGIDHELLLTLKGFADEAEALDCMAGARRRGAEVRSLTVPDDGLDLTAYARVVAAVGADRYCFLNSFSVILADDWLRRMSGALDEPGVELAGATGSWNSHRDYRRYHLGLPSGYAAVFDDRERTRQGFLTLARRHDPGRLDRGRIAFKAAAAVDLWRDRGGFDRFPARHLRTNAFTASRQLMLALDFPPIRSKRDAHRLESGPGSFTSRVQGMGKRVVVVGRDGSLHDPDHWDRSATFWQERQQNLLVADNQTQEYEHATLELRRLLSQLAWGNQARPG